jgi:CubicO group peptidase (beta-lactamase class C family)
MLLAAIVLVPIAAPARAALPPQPAGVPYPTSAWPESPPGAGVDVARLGAALDGAFTAVGHSGLPDTRAVLAVHRGVLVAERYAPGFTRDSRFQSWSMAKTVTQALLGILVRQGRLDVGATAPVPAWQGADDPRGAITIDHLLHMTSGLDNADGGEAPDSFGSRLLFGVGARDVLGFATDVALRHPPGTHWAYSTGTSMILAGIAGRTVGGGRDGLVAFMRAELFGPLGMRSAVPEFDPTGTFLGGAFMWASAHDWARFGLLYLRDGVWEGRRVLPEGWVDYSRTPAPAPNNGVHGAHLWVNETPKEGQFQPLPGLPSSVFSMAGNAGQFVVMVPTRDLVIVRLGEMQASTWRDASGILAAIGSAFPPAVPEE